MKTQIMKEMRETTAYMKEQELLDLKLRLTITEQKLVNEKPRYEIANEKLNFLIAIEKYPQLKSQFSADLFKI